MKEREKMKKEICSEKCSEKRTSASKITSRLHNVSSENRKQQNWIALHDAADCFFNSRWWYSSFIHSSPRFSRKPMFFFHPDPAKSPQDKIWERMREKMKKKKEQKKEKKYENWGRTRRKKSEIGNEKERAKQKALSALRKWDAEASLILTARGNLTSGMIKT